jgi:hypothetical protein
VLSRLLALNLERAVDTLKGGRKKSRKAEVGCAGRSRGRQDAHGHDMKPTGESWLQIRCRSSKRLEATNVTVETVDGTGGLSPAPERGGEPSLIAPNRRAGVRIARFWR